MWSNKQYGFISKQKHFETMILFYFCGVFNSLSDLIHIHHRCNFFFHRKIVLINHNHYIISNISTLIITTFKVTRILIVICLSFNNVSYFRLKMSKFKLFLFYKSKARTHRHS